ncbi:hypothetical protein BJV77DRAFT_944906, partial [Russula vinacea]
RETYDSIKELRLWSLAFMDTMSCNSAKWEEINLRNTCSATPISFNVHYALVETKDDVTDAAVDKLCVALGGTVPRVLAPEPQSVSPIPSFLGLVLTKARWIRRGTRRLRDDFALNLPKTVDKLVLVPGVCQKMAFWCLYAAWD